MPTPIINFTDARRFVQDLTLMVNSVERRHLNPTKALTTIDEFVQCIQGRDETFVPLERSAKAARERIAAYVKSLN